VEIRHGADDDAVADQVTRVLPAAMRAATRWGRLPPSTVVTIHATHESLAAVAGPRATSWMRAWARRGSVDLQSPRAWTRAGASDEALGQILAHELAHCVLFESAGPDWQQRRVPYWFLEGMASAASGEHLRGARADALPAPASLLATDPRSVYATADRAFRDLLLRHGEEGVTRVLRRLGEGHPFPAAFRDATGSPVAEFEAGVVARMEAVATSGGAPAHP
jgi:hypothetical protein